MKNTDIQSKNSIDEADRISIKEADENMVEEDNDIQVYRREGTYEEVEENATEEEDDIQVYRHEGTKESKGNQDDWEEACNTGKRNQSRNGIKKKSYRIKESGLIKVVLVVGVILIILLAIRLSGEEVIAEETASYEDVMGSGSDSEFQSDEDGSCELDDRIIDMYYGYMRIEAAESAAKGDERDLIGLHFAVILEVYDLEGEMYGFSLYSPELDMSFDFEAAYEDDMFIGDSVNEALRFDKYYNFEAYVDDTIEPDVLNGLFVLPVDDENLIISYAFNVSKEGIEVPVNIGSENGTSYHEDEEVEETIELFESYAYGDYKGAWRLRFDEASLNSDSEYLIIDKGHVSLGDLGDLVLDKEGTLVYFIDGIAFQATYVRYWDSIEAHFQAYNDQDGVYLIQDDKVYYGSFLDDFEAVLNFEEVMSYPDYIFDGLHEVNVIVQFTDESNLNGSFMMRSETDGMISHSFKGFEQDEHLALSMD